MGLVAWWLWQWYRVAPAGSLPADSAFLRRARPGIAAAIIVFSAGAGIVCGLAYTCNRPGPFDVKVFLTVAFFTGVDAFGLAVVVFVAAMNMRIRRLARIPVETVVKRTAVGGYPLLRDLR